MEVKERIAGLRRLMSERNIDIYIVPTADFHQSEYVGEHFKARQFITGFTGSAGTAVITHEKAYLWTDGRYFIQAAGQLKGTTVELMKSGEPGVPTIGEFLREALPENGCLGFDGRVVAMSEGLEYRRLAEQKNAGIVYSEDLIDMIWEDRPCLSAEPAFCLEEKYTGESTSSKLNRIRQSMSEAGASAHILTTLDDICWTFNFRGNDIEFFPLVLSYAVITMDGAELYIDETKPDDAVLENLKANNVTIHPYNDIYDAVKAYGAGDAVMIDPGNLNYALYNDLSEDVRKIEQANPEILFKAVKNETEIANIRQAQLKDSVAHIRFMKWLKETIGRETVTEMSAQEKLDEFRAEMGNFIRPSFAPISSYGEHGAVVHYEASPETDAELKEGGLYLTDTGAGFYEGSTDITRTYALGEIPQYMKDDFTLVAVANLALASARFLYGCNGVVLDMLARKPFWDRDLNYNHGTGHGVGYLMNIHEGPAGFRWRYRPGDCHTLEAGMILTDEPGLYIEGSHGIRIENELLIRKGTENEYGQFMFMEPITYVPIDLDAINPDFMTAEEKNLLNEYHKAVFDKISPMLTAEEKKWLVKYTREI